MKLKLFLIFITLSFVSFSAFSQVRGGDDIPDFSTRFSPQELENLRQGSLELSTWQDQAHQLRANFEANRANLDSSHEIMIRMLVDGVDLEAFGVREITLKDGTVMSIEELRELARAKFE